MKILVCISHVPDTTSKINFTDNNKSFDNNGIQYIINPNDEFGLTKAVWMKESHKAEVVGASVGDASCEATLRKCLAIGADRAIRVNMNPLDGFSRYRIYKLKRCIKNKLILRNHFYSFHTYLN